MLEDDFADMCAGKFMFKSMGGRAEGLACPDPGARTPFGTSVNLFYVIHFRPAIYCLIPQVLNRKIEFNEDHIIHCMSSTVSFNIG